MRWRHKYDLQSGAGYALVGSLAGQTPRLKTGGSQMSLLVLTALGLIWPVVVIALIVAGEARR